MNNKYETSELEKAKAHIIVEIIEYIPNAVLSKTIIKKSLAILPHLPLMLAKK